MIARMIESRKGTWAAVCALVLFAALACGAAGSKNDGKSGPMRPTTYDPQVSLAPLVEKVSPAVVNIKTETTVRGFPGFSGPGGFFDFFFRGPNGRDPFRESVRKTQAAGSGFIIDPSGLVVTNHHVVDGVDKIEVQLSDERIFPAKMVGSDERTDVALLRIEGAEKLPTVEFGDSDALRVGDRVVAIGNPFGLDHTVTSGIVSAKERVIGAGPYDDFIQTDASINPGNSGGPLFDLNGRVVGINTAINPAGEGIGFAIPANLASSMIDSLRSKGRVVRGWLGIVPQPLTDDLARALGAKDKNGALVANVQDGSPADRGGLQAGDVIVKIGKRPLENAREIFGLVAGLAPGEKVPFTVLRKGEKKVLKVEIGEQPGSDSVSQGLSIPKEDRGAAETGVTVKPLDDVLKRKLGAQEVESGVVAAEIDPSSPLSKVLSPGDVIVEINREKVRDPSHFDSLMASQKKGDDLLLLIFRRGSWEYKVVRL